MSPRGFAWALVLTLTHAGVALAATFYVDSASGTCSSSGPGTLAQPYCTISAALSAHSGSDVTILVKPGTYREIVTVPTGGTSGHPLVIQSFGGPAVIDGADDFSSPANWSPFSSGVWLAPSVTWSPKQVFLDGVRLASSIAPPDSLPAGSYVFVQGAGLYVNIGGVNPGTHTLLVGHRGTVFLVLARHWVIVDGFTVTRTEDKSILVSDTSSDVTISHNTVSYSARFAIQAIGSSRVRILYNVTTDNLDHGISLTAGSTGCVVEDNESARNAQPIQREANGLYMFGAPGNLIQRNRWHDNQDSGQHMQSGSNNNISINNMSYNNGDHGYDHLGATGTQHVGDVAYGNFRDGFSIEGIATGTNVVDCIAVNNGLTANEFDLYVEPGSDVGFVSHHNIFWNATAQKFVRYKGVQYATLAAYQAASGKDTLTIQADPLFVSPATGDFHLQPGSPAIDDATTLVANWPPFDADRRERWDDPSTANNGDGPVLFADRGAFEYIVPTAAVPETRGGPAVRLSAATPNPCRGRVAFTLEAPQQPTRIDWRVVDVQGRELLALSAVSVSGRTVLHWDGTDRAGTPAPAGLYWASVRCDGAVSSQRFVVVR